MAKQTSSSEQKSQSLVSKCSTSAAVLVCVTVLTSLDVAVAEQASELQDSISSQHNNYGVAFAACVSAVAFLLILVFVLTYCTDCYKSEVSTDFHPATGQTVPKWGGAAGYTAAASSNLNDAILGAGFTDEVIIPGQGNDQALPYTMIPSQVPEAQGFRGYGPAPTAQGFGGYSSGGGNLAGYGGEGGAGHGGERPQRLPGAHVSPMNEPEEPPPSYFSSSNH